MCESVCTQTHMAHINTHTHIAGHLSGLSTWSWRGEMSPQPYQDNSSCVHPGPTSPTLTGWKHPSSRGGLGYSHTALVSVTLSMHPVAVSMSTPTTTTTTLFSLSFFSNPLRCILFKLFLQISQHRKTSFGKTECWFSVSWNLLTQDKLTAE